MGGPSPSLSPSPEWSGRRVSGRTLPLTLSFSGVEWEEGEWEDPPPHSLLLRSGVGGVRVSGRTLPLTLSFSGVEWEEGEWEDPPPHSLLLRSGVGGG